MTLIQKYVDKFGVGPDGRPFYAVLREFDRTLSMYRDGRSFEDRLDRIFEGTGNFYVSGSLRFSLEQRTTRSTSRTVSAAVHLFIRTISRDAFHARRAPRSDPSLLSGFSNYSGKTDEHWVSSYIETHIWDLDIRKKAGS
jgi:hypothetical protein